MLAPSSWVMRFLPGITAGGRVLDVACGSGRHLRALRAAGYHVTGVDCDLSGLSDIMGEPRAELIEADLEAGEAPPWRGRKFHGVIVTNYLWRPLLDDIVAAVAADGLLIYETFASGNERYGRPSRPDFLLEPGELIALVAPRLTVIAFESVTIAEQNVKDGEVAGKRVVQRIAAAGPEHAWLTSPPMLPPTRAATGN